jgi:hypothetical protein
MEVIATAAETKSLVDKSNNKSFLVFTEDRLHSIKMQNDLPQRWILKGNQTSFSDKALRGEYLAFQLGVYALQDLPEVFIEFSDLNSATGKKIAAKNIQCINTNGTKYDGSVFANRPSVLKGKIQAMWCGVDVPETTQPGVYNGKAIVHIGNQTKEIALHVTIENGITKNGGIDHPEKMTRLKWLNSTMAQENTVIAPYTPLVVSDSGISLLGRKLILNKDGFPAQIQTFFTPEMTSIGSTPNNLFAEAVHFHFYDSKGKQPLLWKSNPINYLKKEAGTVAWQVTSASAALQMDVNAALEFDGFLSYTVKFTALEDMAFNEINFHLPIEPSAAKYLMGLGLKGGDRPDTLLWKWDVAHKNQDGGWIGSVNAGLQFSFRDEKYSRPLNTNFYLFSINK